MSATCAQATREGCEKALQLEVGLYSPVFSGGFWNDPDPYRISGFPYFSRLALKLSL